MSAAPVKPVDPMDPVEHVKFAYWVPHVSGGQVTNKIERRTDGGLGEREARAPDTGAESEPESVHA
ncbi:hypothetical protein OG568_05695 [Streptomyces sp. NBC_01450]|uniref:hypothetical protein n=1 Tax=Streptomyces sp. NBC_01450 TaxID=2903871 RepID=UPI002E30EC5B|nr:hypothetical protein [Streptomyces sp. NBC_01450]